MKSNRFYLACLRDTVGTNVAFHCKDGRGYATDLDAAHVYTREEAQHEWDTGRPDIELPLCADRVDALSEWHVDMQYLPLGTKQDSGIYQWVYFEARRYNGNDVYWLRHNGLPTCDFSQATVYLKPSTDPKVVSVPRVLAEANKRRTIDISLVSRRSMIQAAGLITPEHVKRNSRRVSNPKTRWNCPACGKISWQYNPYDFEGCTDVYCEEWNSNRW